MAAIGSPHAAVTNRLARLFTRALRDDASLVNVQSPLRLDAYKEPELPPRQGLTDSATDGRRKARRLVSRTREAASGVVTLVTLRA